MAMMGITIEIHLEHIDYGFTAASRVDALIATPIMDFAAALSNLLGKI